jgi:hypothetical protein
LHSLGRVYWFEIFECVRKLSLVGIPVFYVQASLAQLVSGLIVCFLSVMMYTWFKPYRDPKDDALQMICQVQVFFALLSKIILDHPGVTDDQRNALGGILVVTSSLPVVVGFLLDTDVLSWSLPLPWRRHVPPQLETLGVETIGDNLLTHRHPSARVSTPGDQDTMGAHKAAESQNLVSTKV